MVSRLPAAGVALVLLFVSHPANAQEGFAGHTPAEQPPDTSARANAASLSFNRLINTYHWNEAAFYQNFWGPFSLKLDDNFLSTLIQTDRKLIADEHSLDLTLAQRVWSPLSVAMKATFFSLSDNKNIGISNASSQAVYGGLSYRPVEEVLIDPFIGVRYDHQFDQKDSGPAYLLNVAARGLDYNGYQTSLTGMWEYDRLDPRTLETRSAYLKVDRTFFEQTRNSLQFLYTRNRRDFYFIADPRIQREFNVSQNIETRTEDALTVYDSLAYGVTKRLAISFQGDIYARDIGRRDRYQSPAGSLGSTPNTDIKELRLESAALIDYAPWNSLHATAQFTYQERDEDHGVQGEPLTPAGTPGAAAVAEERKNNHSRRTSLASAMTLGLQESDTVSFAGSGSLLRYDTPSILNDDDRDELWYIANAVWFHRLNRHFAFWLQANVSLTHLVYILSSRSADNTWNRVFRLVPRLAYAPSADLTTTNTFEVLANYTVYDFESPSSPIRSYAFRQFSFTDSTGLSLTRRLQFEWFSQFRVYEQGELRWSDFSERPQTSFEDQTYVATLRYRLNPGLLFSVGIRYFSQRRYLFNGPERTLDRYLRSIGPVTAIDWDVSERTKFSTSGWFETQTQTGTAGHSFANLTMTLFVHM
jgi:hypothetical protein